MPRSTAAVIDDSASDFGGRNESTGTVTFKNGATTMGTATLSDGKATFKTAALVVGTHSITAVYGGSVDFSSSTSPALTQTVDKASSATAVASSLNPLTYGIAVTFNATVKGKDGGTPTGTVTFTDEAKTLKSVTLVVELRS